MKHNNYILSNDWFCNKESVLQKNYYVSALIARYASEYIWIIGKTNLGSFAITYLVSYSLSDSSI